ncbi:hypothetical protein [Paenibacillus lutimineralis]|uniref:Uncharacterized protein n=1 Tax=Paenibacillus lutimineralis TaxID=2707005 RepID=A0A3Q9I9U0_9BACL|nr:hypothetical protein [Paenibacillus lutimineralis]AZS14409.1 hypothetical protein EI981_08045 [Paenibacillus lutimineralis]
MSFDLEVLVVNQAVPLHLPFQSRIELLNEQDDRGVQRFKDKWKVMSHAKGVWYSLVKDDEGIQNAYLLCDSDFESSIDEVPVPFWVNNEDVLYNLTPLIIRPEFRDDFEKVLRYLLENSPIGTLMFLARYQGGDYELIQGTLTIEEFVEQLDKKNILFNVCYVLAK